MAPPHPLAYEHMLCMKINVCKVLLQVLSKPSHIKKYGHDISILNLLEKLVLYIKVLCCVSV